MVWPACGSEWLIASSMMHAVLHVGVMRPMAYHGYGCIEGKYTFVVICATGTYTYGILDIVHIITMEIFKDHMYVNS